MFKTKIGRTHFPNPGQAPDFTVTSKHLNPSEPLLISWGCKSITNVMLWNNRHLFHLSQFRRTKVLDQRVTGLVPSGTRGESGLSPCFWWLPCTCITPFSVSVFIHSVVPVHFCLYPNFLLLIRVIFTRLGPPQLHYDLILMLLHLQIPYFQIWSHSQFPRGDGLNISIFFSFFLQSWGVGHNSTHHRTQVCIPQLISQYLLWG